jgi:hypothetical protein
MAYYCYYPWLAQLVGVRAARQSDGTRACMGGTAVHCSQIKVWAGSKTGSAEEDGWILQTKRRRQRPKGGKIALLVG